VVGQDHIVQTLCNAIELGKVHHAYLFVGSRGTGKTSMAKLLACALNCEGGPKAEFPPDDPACAAIMGNNSLDVVEMDAASNNSVDDIRELRENVALAPMSGRSRVYILDEAHMLSNSAWNAFLKTLEEPPSHVVFVLATTEVHKVPETIVDRCHRFDFRRPSHEQMTAVLSQVAQAEGIKLSDSALGMIAGAAQGSFRDAIGTLEQLVTYTGTDVDETDVAEILGIADAELIFQATDAVIDGAPKQVLASAQGLADSGREPAQFMRDHIAHLRQLFVYQILGQVSDTFSVTAGQGERIANQGDRFQRDRLMATIDRLTEALAEIKEGAEPRIQLEIALLKAAQPDRGLSFESLASRIERLEALVGAGDDAALKAPASPAQGGEHNAVSAASQQAGPQAEASPQPKPAAGSEDTFQEQTATQVEHAQEPSPYGLEAEASPQPKPAAGSQDAFQAQTATQVEQAQEPSSYLSLEGLCKLWPQAVEYVQKENGMVGALLGQARPASFDGETLIAAFPSSASFSRKKAEANKRLVESALKDLTDQHVRVSFDLEDSDAPTSSPSELSEAELLQRLKDEFGAEEIFEDATTEGD
jgi:DNA polymerase-3 subunit gamma/tau